MERVRDAGAGFRSITEAVDTTTAAGRMVMQVLGSFAEFERSMVRERTRAPGGSAGSRREGWTMRAPTRIKSRSHLKNAQVGLPSPPAAESARCSSGLIGRV